MKLNSETKICGSNLLLVPYRKHHVPKYIKAFLPPSVWFDKITITYFLLKVSSLDDI